MHNGNFPLPSNLPVGVPMFCLNPVYVFMLGKTGECLGLVPPSIQTSSPRFLLSKMPRQEMWHVKYQVRRSTRERVFRIRSLFLEVGWCTRIPTENNEQTPDHDDDMIQLELRILPCHLLFCKSLRLHKTHRDHHLSNLLPWLHQCWASVRLRSHLGLRCDWDCT